MEKRLIVDNKGRININSLLNNKHISSFKAVVEEDGKITLEPYAEIPAKELWLYESPKALSSVKEGLAEAGRGEVHDLKIDYSKHLNDQD